MDSYSPPAQIAAVLGCLAFIFMLANQAVSGKDPYMERLQN